jgi:hypothetical protein
MLRSLIESWERSLWTQENRRVRRPFAWGIEHLGGNPGRDEPKGFLSRYAQRALAASGEFFSTDAAPWYELRGRVLVFPSALRTACPENNLVFGRWFPVDGTRRQEERRAVVVLPQWNADWEGHVDICRLLNRFGISALRLTLPYHDRRRPAGFERADLMVSANIGLTLEASRQAVLDSRRAVGWLGQQGYARLGILGTSIGSSVAFITLAHEPALRAGVFLHVSTFFGDVVRTGLSTAHVWEDLASFVNAREIRQFWAPISPFPYAERLEGTTKRLLLVSGRYDLSFLPEFSQELCGTLNERRIAYERMVLPCGHYTLGKWPFNYWAGLGAARFLRRALG